MAVSFIGGGNQSTWEKTTDLSQVTDNVVSSTPHLSRIRTHNFSGDRHYNYHKIMTKTAPVFYKDEIIKVVFKNLILIRQVYFYYNIYHYNSYTINVQSKIMFTIQILFSTDPC